VLASGHERENVGGKKNAGDEEKKPSFYVLQNH